MNERELGLLNDSFERCMSHPDFMDVFYDLFLNSTPVVAEKFEGIDIRHQKKAVKASLINVLTATSRRLEDIEGLEEIARRHGRSGADIPPYLYELWVQSLIGAVRRCDRRCDEECLDIWRRALQPAVEYMISKY